MPDLKAFLRELAELSQKHGLYIGGCGDCGSPWITGEAGVETYLEHLTYAREDRTYAAYNDTHLGDRVVRNRKDYGLEEE